MKHLATFKNFVRESLTPDEIIAAGAQRARTPKGTEDEELDKAAAENGADAPSYPVKAPAPTKAPQAAKGKSKAVNPKKPAVAKPGRKLCKGGTEYVAQWQEKLKKSGYDIDVDGGWGKQTQEAYAAYISQKYGASSPQAKKAAAGTAPGGAQGSPGSEVWKFIKKHAWDDTLGGVVTGAAKGLYHAVAD